MFPVGCAQSGKGGDQVDAAVVVDRRIGEAELFQLTEGPDDLSATTQYLLIKDRVSCFVTFSCDASTADAHASTFVEIVESFRWSKQEER